MQRKVAKLVLQQHHPLRIIVALVKRKGIALQEVPNAKNYNPKLPGRLQIRLGSHQRYTLSVPFETLCNDTPNKANALKKSQGHIKLCP
ncbi:hypothetical protein BD408DRAFT_245213 [Parasitella parasitica]|nr:hypothetical protein BD408DRAFT_245213 [Parasitella parasitica]